ncbi:hypothetical protein CYLTODRAFT_423574 [Cylindrobasidium torrendii FP15055 ss-10]|uniref:Uncharacterized protein n=1 Tax=Cylindrobasidium torrendii FP15055 ss-10 TaxID=1314674 RepID=A0A0D7B7U5_9AGAR|nr:hypothetical protein CYLTODRAFT_423574 [Cylindrobasidium torrendii FP15055 ss-10]
MHRFRKKSDAKRQSPHSSTHNSYASDAPPPPPPAAPTLNGVLPDLPLENDFRTSLILPDLSRRFSLLRSTAGTPLSIEQLRQKLAEQRARGDQVQVSEEEEDMLLESLGLRSRAATPSKSQENVATPSTPTTPRSAKRYSNNLFGSNRFRDQTYMRSVQKAGSRAQSAASSDVDAFDEPSPTPISKAAFKRASLALKQAIDEMEEEEPPEDEIVLPRSPPIVRSSIDHKRGASPDPFSSPTRSHDSKGMAISSDQQLRMDMEDRGPSPVPARAVPGYIPGMPRPMTPSDGYSTTPRATSPSNFVFPNRKDAVSPFAVIPRRDIVPSAVRHSPGPSYSTTPLFLQRSLNNSGSGSNNNSRHIPDASETAIDYDQSFDPRRAASPLSTSSYAPSLGSRPGTPSNASAWPQPPSSAPAHRRGHSRNGSWFSDSVDTHGSASMDQTHKGIPSRSLKSPALPDSPLIDATQDSLNTIASSQYDSRPMSPISNLDIGQTYQSAPTREPSSPTFSSSGSPRSKRSSRQQTSGPYSYSPFNPLVFSPPVNSSRSSFESTGSSYHSWDDDKHDTISSLFTEGDAQQPPWHDVSGSEQSGSIASAAVSDEEAESLLRAIGLRRTDFLVIQDKLVEFASTKASPPMETTAPSATSRPPSLRRRRPSTSQSNYSYNGTGRIASPPPQAPSAGPQPVNHQVEAVKTEDQVELPSPTTMRNRNLHDLLFGHEEGDGKGSPNDFFPSQKNDPDLTLTVHDRPLGSPSMSPALSPTSSTNAFLYSPSRNPSAPRLPPTPQEEEELAKEIERKAEAAMFALKGAGSKSNVNLADHHTSSTPSRKRISPNQISTPTLVSASTSVDAIPLRSSGIPTSESSKMSRFKKLQGTLRRPPKQVPTGEEVTPFIMDQRSQPIQQPPPTLNLEVQVPSSAVEPRFKMPMPSPPASAGPGLKGFMSRFRNKPRTVDPSPQVANRLSPNHSLNTSTNSFGTPAGAPTHSYNPSNTSFGSSLSAPDPAHAPRQMVSELSSGSQTVKADSPTTPKAPNGALPLDRQPQMSTLFDSDAIKQFLDLGSGLGLDQEQLSNLVRTASTSSKGTSTLLSRSNTVTSSSPSTTTGRSHSSLGRNASTVGRSDSSGMAKMFGRGGPSSTGLQRNPSTIAMHTLSRNNSAATALTRNGSSATVTRHGSNASAFNGGGLKRNDSAVLGRGPTNLKRSDSSVVFNQHEGHVDALDVPTAVQEVREAGQLRPPNRKPAPEYRRSEVRSTVLRRTIIMPSEMGDTGQAFDLNAIINGHGGGLMPGLGGKSNRRRSTASSRSVQERAPTPPPPRGNKRYSRDQAPPMPLQVPAMEPSNSNIDSLYEMYGDGRPVMAHSNESRPALEVIELANGETIWSIVNGLRDDDDEDSLYDNRVSMASEFDDEDDSMQVYVKEHHRTGSDTSQQQQLRNQRKSMRRTRAETKVFYSSPAHIGRLIENLSSGMEAGSFNFRGNNVHLAPPVQSNTSSMSSSDPAWSVEERLDHMLGQMRPT